MENDSRILKRVGRNTGYTIPENYFDSFRSKILSEIPDLPKTSEQKLPIWTRLKPYLYMAAMFAGIWCMMKMFHTISTSDLNLDNPPEAIVMAMAASDHQEWSATSADLEIYQVEEEILSEYSNFEDFKRDFESDNI